MFHGEEFWLVRFLFQRGLAILYLLAFLVAAFQFRALAGEDGLLPLEWYAEGAFEYLVFERSFTPLAATAVSALSQTAWRCASFFSPTGLGCSEIAPTTFLTGTTSCWTQRPCQSPRTIRATLPARKTSSTGLKTVLRNMEKTLSSSNSS
ncbi:hypothetical protein C446_14614 [Halobiforma nitratireducens JCM 10879]|uniref:Uncharacterized protein n=1 Tax=Halobiforma nitratireducens JCM 10879 TaxID=1227454 RepID=M0LJ53_9EURY|nr:hypothetical protein C446_14614 [Halobiforma nitratireducens JCM 10879]